jgi:hypothetical protein
MTEHDECQIVDPIVAEVEIHDPVDVLVAETAITASAPLSSASIDMLSKLRERDRVGYEEARARLKRAGCRVAALDEAMGQRPGGLQTGEPSQTDVLLKISESAELFHVAEGTGFADIIVDGHRETWKVSSTGYKDSLRHGYYDETGGAPNSESLQAALNVIEAKARHDGPERTIHVRVGAMGGKLYLDLVDKAWRAVEIDAENWSLADSPPIRFRRAPGMKSLPEPIAGGIVEQLRPFLNVRSDSDFVLIVAWLLCAMGNRGSYPVLVLAGEQGTAKSTLTTILRSLIDPNVAPRRSLPRDERDLFIGANNSLVLAFDNISTLSQWTSDALCRLSTGGAYAVRKNYTDDDEMLFDAVRPIILNGIENIVERQDLADRALFITLEPIPDAKRLSEKELMAKFETVRPQILAALLDGVVVGLGKLSETRLPNLSRMADFVVWATACETAFWPSGTVTKAYRENIDEAVDDVIDADPIATVIRAFMQTRDEWTGTASELLTPLTELAQNNQRKDKNWPNSPRALSGGLRRAANFLRKRGITIEFRREGRERTRNIHITRAPDKVEGGPSASAIPSVGGYERDDFAGSGGGRIQTDVPSADGADDGHRPADHDFAAEPGTWDSNDDHDHADAGFPAGPSLAGELVECGGATAAAHASG